MHPHGWQHTHKWYHEGSKAGYEIFSSGVKLEGAFIVSSVTGS